MRPSRISSRFASSADGSRASDARIASRPRDAASLRVHHSFSELPGPGYEPREYDPRSGFFGMTYADYSTPLGESMTTKDAEDPIVKKPLLQSLVGMVVPAGKSVRDPLVAALYGDLAGLPPLLIHVGSRETLLDDARRIAERAKKAGVSVKLHEWEGQIHVFQVFCTRLDEGVQALDEIGEFVQQHTE